MTACEEETISRRCWEDRTPETHLVHNRFTNKWHACSTKNGSPESPGWQFESPSPTCWLLSFYVQQFFMVTRAVLLSMTVEPSHPLTMATLHVLRSSALSRRTATAMPAAI